MELGSPKRGMGLGCSLALIGLIMGSYFPEAGAPLLIGIVVAIVSGVRYLAKGLSGGTLELESARVRLVEDVREHLEVLVRKRLQKVSVDAYGRQDTTKWRKEVEHFVTSVARDTGCLMYIGNEAYEIVDKLVQAEQGKSEVSFAEDGPLEFEEQCAAVLRKHGWKASTTAASGDQGADIIAHKARIHVVLQCKLYSKPVGNKAVQEVNAAKTYYTAGYAVVVSNQGFTASAEQLAGRLGVLLLHYTDLPKLEVLVGIGHQVPKWTDESSKSSSFAGSIEQRLQVIADLHFKGVISDAEYNAKRAQILGDV